MDLKHPVTLLVRRIFSYCTIFVQAGILFRCQTLDEIVRFVTGMVTRAGFGHAYFQEAFTALGLDVLGIARLGLSFAILVQLGHWEQYDLPGAKTKTGSAQRVTSVAYFLVIIALCWISLLATHDAAEFAYFQF